MKKLRSSPTPPSLTPVTLPSAGPLGSWVRFWFTPSDPIGLHVLRMLTGLLVLFWLLILAGQREAFFGLNGWFDVEAFRETARLPGGAPVSLPSWSICYLATNSTLLNVIYWSSVAIVALFTVGLLPRITAVLTWVIVASFTWNPAFPSDAEALLLVLSFYLMVGYVLFGLRDGFLTVWPLGGRRESARPSLGANVAMRLFQVHFAMALVVTGLHKLQSGDWWAGAALWYPLHSAFTTTAASIKEEATHANTDLTLLSLGAYAALAWQIGFPLFAWRPRWRIVLVGGGIVAWLGSALIFGLPLFGPAILIGCLAYVTPREWRRVLGLAASLSGLRRLPAQRAAQTGSPTAKEPTAALVGGKHA